MAALLFGDAIDYRKARIYNRRYLPFGLQPKNCAMTPRLPTWVGPGDAWRR